MKLEAQSEEAGSRERQATALVSQLQARLKSQDKRHKDEASFSSCCHSLSPAITRM